MTENAAEGPVSARMQALLSRAVEEQVSEQRQAAGALSELRTTVAQLQDSVRGAASNDTVERLESAVTTVVADLRTSTTLLSQRLEALTQRVESIGAETAAPMEQSTVRLGALAAEVSAQAASVERMRAALDLMSAFPEALAALQRDVAGLHDRLSPLGDVQTGVADLNTRTAATLHALLPQLQALEEKVAAIGAVPGPDRLRDAVVDALTVRLERLQQSAERPVVGPEVLRSGLGDLRASLVASVGEATEPITTGLLSLESRLDQLETRLGALDVLVAAEREHATARATQDERLAQLGDLRAQLDAVSANVRALRADTGSAQVQGALQSLSADLHALAAHLAEPAPLPVDDLSGQVSARVADRLVDVLAPRISDVVLTRVSAALVTQLGEALGPRLRAETDGVLRSLSAESEKRILAHVDEAMLTLAEALLRRKGVRRPAGAAAPSVPPTAVPEPPEERPESVQEVLDRLAADEPLVEETTSHEPAPASGGLFDDPGAVLDAIEEAEFPEIVSASPGEAAPSGPAAAEAAARPAVTTGLAPAPASSGAVASPVPAQASAPAAESVPVHRVAQATVHPSAEAEPAPAPAKKAAAKKAPAKKAPARKAAAKKAPAKGAGTAREGAAPPRKAARPRPRPFLEPTPDLDDHDVTPVRNGGTPPAPPMAPPPVTSSPFAPPGLQQPLPPAPAVRPAEPKKRKPWWRPGG